MHSIGERVVYGAGGVMEIVDLRDISVGDVSRSYYVLREVGAASMSETLIPTDNAALVSQMRPLLSSGELISVVRRAKSEPLPEWISDNRRRAESFKHTLASGDRCELMKMILSIREAGKRRGEEGKKNFLSDENAMRKAERLLYSEISIVMGIPFDEVGGFVDSI